MPTWRNAAKPTIPQYITFQNGDLIEFQNGDLMISFFTFAVWANLVKVLNETFVGYILTPDENNILVGENEDEILIWQEASSNPWNHTQKQSSNWQYQQKIA